MWLRSIDSVKFKEKGSVFSAEVGEWLRINVIIPI